ncbi:hypothetical protein [Mangrovicella endophytica]|uniref:hypothetical protein n=1 Tax=Mangrovicella endophytica TaxID=2066697 RepID=UPI000C9E1791|nr:hypothetical protein [Mangrovicella endophytica]
MDRAKVIPLVIAGFVGFLIGWLLGPDVDDVEEALSARIDQLQTSVAAVDQKTTALTEKVGSPAANTDFGPAFQQLSENLETQTKGLGSTIGDVSGKIDALDQRLGALEGKMDAAAAAAPAAPAPAASQPAAAAGGDQAAGFAGEIGSTGAILLPNQTAIFGTSRLGVASLSAEAGIATLRAGDQNPTDVAAGSSVDLGNGCSVTLVGVAAGAAYLKSNGCAAEQTGQTAASSAAAPAGGEGTAPGGAAGPSEGGKTARVTEQGAAGAAAAAGNAAPAGSVEAPAATPSPAAAQGGASAPQPASDAGAAQGNAPAAAPADTAAATAPAPAAQPSGDAAAASGATDTAAAAPGGPVTLVVGQATTVGGKGLSLSRISDDTAFFRTLGGPSVEAKVGTPADLGDGCQITVEAIENGSVRLAPASCGTSDSGGAPAAASPAGSSAAPAEGSAPAATTASSAAPADTAAPVPAVPAATEGTTAETSGADQASPAAPTPVAPAGAPSDTPRAAASTPAAAPAAATDAPEKGANGYGIGETAAFGEKRVFVSGITDAGATLAVMGKSRQTVAPGASADLGNGCQVMLDRIENRRAFLTGTGC